MSETIAALKAETSAAVYTRVVKKKTAIAVGALEMVAMTETVMAEKEAAFEANEETSTTAVIIISSINMSKPS